MKKGFLYLVLFVLAACSRPAVDVQIVSEVASRQCLLMEEYLTEETFPKTFEGDSLVTSKASWWCSGFYAGTCWYSYLLGKDAAVRALAVRQTAKLMDVNRLCRDHDIGFQVMCSSGLAWKTTGDSLYLEVIRDAAGKLAGRFSPVTGTIKSWNSKRFVYPVIIDNMMNLELLTYAAGLFDVPQWRDIAIAHARTTLVNHFREDGSCYHLVDYNPEDGSVFKKQTWQGLSDESSWSRGQGWALYGYSMMYRETGLTEFLEHAEKVAAYLLPLLADRPVPAWDFDADAPDDASAAAVMASGFLELGTLTTDAARGKAYFNMAEKILKALSSPEYLCREGECAGFLLKHSTGFFLLGSEVDVPLSYADYYFMEALYRYHHL
ncbi:MAG: glycoside hydrolase family 88 protein [Bacteroidales bacterium]|nr:glycoside hydrolase family 88 protein [Bacteroidales bacterium]